MSHIFRHFPPIPLAISAKVIQPYCMSGISCDKIVSGQKIFECGKCGISLCKSCSKGSKRHRKCRVCYEKIQKEGSSVKKKKMDLFSTKAIQPTKLFSPNGSSTTTGNKRKVREQLW